jgi:hypothetical protein
MRAEHFRVVLAAIKLLEAIESEMQSDFPQLSDEILAAAAGLQKVIGGEE